MITFVILHYEILQQTINCVNSILKTMVSTDNFKIIIVDNGSKNGSGNQLEKIYIKNNDIKVIISKDNLGFAKGNNLGFQYAKSELKSKYIVLLNNDVEILNKNFLNDVENSYKKSKAGVIGPLILSENGKYTSNPMRFSPLKIKDIERYKKEYSMKLKHPIIDKFNKTIKRITNKLIGKKGSRDDFNLYESYLRKHFNVVLHGSFMLFTPNYISKFNGLFPETFMYGEEDILYYQCRIKQIKILYDPNLIIYHYEGGATKKSSKNSLNFFYKNSLQSLDILENYIRGNINAK